MNEVRIVKFSFLGVVAMGERLLMAVMDRRMVPGYRAIWLYHHWFGYKERFVAMMSDIILANELYKRCDMNSMVRAILNYSEGFKITGPNDDRNYMAFIDARDREIIWFEFPYNMDYDFYKEFYELNKTGLINVVETILAAYSVDYRKYKFSNLKNTISMAEEAIKLVESMLERLQTRKVLIETDIIDYWVNYRNKLVDMVSNIVSESL